MSDTADRRERAALDAIAAIGWCWVGGDDPNHGGMVEITGKATALTAVKDLAAALRADTGAKAAARFAEWAIRNSCWDGVGLDGADVEEKALELGLLVATQQPEPCGDNCACLEFANADQFPVDCMRFAPWLQYVTGAAGNRTGGQPLEEHDTPSG